jgi:hypothetical protein
MIMFNQERLLRLRMASCLILTTAVITLLAPVAGAQVYLYGRGDFQATTNPGSVIVADFNGDGRPDLAVSDFQNNLVSILLGSAGGGFVAKGTFATGSFPTAMVAADFNGDKKIDLAVVNANAGTISILLGNGDGTFQGRIDYAVGQGPVGIVAADFDSDGNIDLATISTGDSAVAVLLGKGDGSFEVQALIPVASGPSVLAGGDVNGDGKIDLITVSNGSSGGTITSLVSKGDGTFTQVTSQISNFASALAVGDFNRDGKLDAVMVVDFGNTYLSLGNGDGSFQTPVAIPNAPSNFGQPPVLLIGDFNHDRKLDIAFDGVWVLLGNGDGTFQNPILSFAVTTPMAVDDVNGDGEPDLVGITNTGAAIVLLGNGDGSFLDLQSVALSSTMNLATAGVAADFNGDGKLDLAVAETNFSSGQVSVELGKGNGTFKQPIVSPLGTPATDPILMIAADFNGDGKSDLAALDNNGNGFELLLGNGDGSFGTGVDTPLSYSVSSFAAGDFNKDGKADLVVMVGNTNSPTMNIYLSNGDGTFNPGAQYVVYPNSIVSVADVNGDGNLDLVAVTTSGFGSPSSFLVFLGNGDGTFKNPLVGPSDFYSSQAALADFNGDGKVDIAVGVSGFQSSGIAFLAGNGDGTFAKQVYSDPGFGFSGSLIAADFNGDHKLDLAERSNSNSSATLVMGGNGDGTFGLPVEFDANSNGFGGGGVFGDFNSDGVSDLGIAGSTTSSNTPVVFLYLSTPTPNVSPTAVSFGPEQVGKTSSPRKVRLTNAGNARLNISGITVSGDFLEQHSCGKSLAVGQSCTIQVNFKPRAKGIRTGQVTITDNAPGRTQRISLKGTGK